MGAHRSAGLQYLRPEVVEGEVVDLDEVLVCESVRELLVVLPRCACGKDGTAQAHGAVVDDEGWLIREPLGCAEVLAIQARVRADRARDERRPVSRLARWLRRGGA